MVVSGPIDVLWKRVEAFFHMTTTASSSADIFVVVTLFIVTGYQLNRTIMYQCCVPNVTITTSPKGLVNAFMLIKFFLNSKHNIPMCMKRPIVLVCDGYGSQ